MASDSPSFRQTVTAQLRQDLSVADKLVSLPERVMRSIAVREDASEILIKVIQLFIVIVFAALYGLAPKTHAGTAFTPVPYVLAGYFGLTVIGLIWALQARLPDWAVYFSILIDMLLLMTLILSFHIQYEQPASFVLKAPALLYVFIFIALRALRFEARFVVAAGLAAALGWVMMIYYVINIDPEDTMITRSYVEYLTGNAILIGAEFDKILAILTVTLVLGLSLRRGRHLLVDAVAESTAARDLSRFFDESVASQIRGADQEIAAGEGVKRTAAVLNVDIRGFTTLAAAMDPSRVMTLLAEYQAQIVPVIQRNGGTIDKFLGDGIMATFGASSDSDSYAADALRTTDEIIETVDGWNAERMQSGLDPIVVNLSVASGPLVFGAVGGLNRLEYTVIGAVVNLSAKLEKHNKALAARAVTTDECLRTAVQQGYRERADYRVDKSGVDGVEKQEKVVVLHD